MFPLSLAVYVLGSVQAETDSADNIPHTCPSSRSNIFHLSEHTHECQKLNHTARFKAGAIDGSKKKKKDLVLFW